VLVRCRNLVLRNVAYDDGDVDIGSFLDSLGISARVGDDDQARFLERAGDVIGEVTGGEATGDGNGAGMRGELEDSTLTVGTGGNDADCSVSVMYLYHAISRVQVWYV
jgi:hypothetical protein